MLPYPNHLADMTEEEEESCIFLKQNIDPGWNPLGYSKDQDMPVFTKLDQSWNVSIGFSEARV